MVEINQTIQLIIVDTIGGIIKNLPFFILIIVGVRTIAKSIQKSGENIIKKVPVWLEQYDQLKMKHYRIYGAIGSRSER